MIQSLNSRYACSSLPMPIRRAHSRKICGKIIKKVISGRSRQCCSDRSSVQLRKIHNAYDAGGSQWCRAFTENKYLDPFQCKKTRFVDIYDDNADTFCPNIHEVV